MRFRVLDGWRGIAALLVAVERLHAHGVLSEAALIRHSYLFVDFFFVLSGFVITHAYLDRIKDGPSTTAFVIRRFGRLWPLHAALLGFLIIVEALRLVAAARGATLESAPFTGDTSPFTIMTNLFLVQALGVHSGLTWNMPSWSISTEFWTYILFAVVALTARTRLTVVSVILVGVSLLLVGAFSPKGMDTTFDLAIFRCIAGFFVGSLVYRLWRAMRDRTEETVGARAWWLEPMVVVGAVSFVIVAGRGPLSLAAPFVFGAVVYVFAFERGPISRLMDTRPVHALGDWSYSIYMVAYPVQIMFERAINTAGRWLGGSPWADVATAWGERRMIVLPWPGAADLLVVVYVATVLVVSWITFRLIEDPARRLFARLADIYEARAPARTVVARPAE